MKKVTSRAENPSARAMARASSARTHLCDINLTLPVNMSVMRLDTLKFPAFPGLSSVDGFCLGSAVVLYSPWFLPPVKLLPDNFRDRFLLNAEFSGV